MNTNSNLWAIIWLTRFRYVYSFSMNQFCFKAHADRVKEQEIEKAEQARLEEILNMCAEYEKQAQCEKQNKPPTPNR